MNEHMDIEALARLSRLALTEDEKREFATDLEAMIAFGRTLNKADLSTATCGKNAPTSLRADEPAPSLDRTAIMDMAATSSDGFVTVVRVLSEAEKEASET